MSIRDLLAEIIRFRDERDWGRFHTPKNVAAAVSIEAGELQELMLWKTDKEIRDFVSTLKGKRRFEEEIADVLIFALLLCHEVGIDPAVAIQRKIAQNAKKYPVALAKGNATKYSEFQDQDDATNAGQWSLFPGNPPH